MTATDHDEAAVVKKKGLLNLGNTCYINTAVQCLLAVPDFARFLLGLPRDPDKRLLMSLVDLFVQLLVVPDPSSAGAGGAGGGIAGIVSPARFVAELRHAIVGLRVHDPNDIQEFFALFIDKLNAQVCVKLKPDDYFDAEFQHSKSLTRMQKMVRVNWYKAVWNEHSAVKETFYGMTITQIRCSNCDKIHHNYEVFSSVMLPAPSATATLHDCMAAHFAEEPVSEDWKCDGCNACAPDNAKVSRLCRLPKVLMVCIKRFAGMRKNREVVDAPEVLDVAPWTLPDERRDGRLSTSYDLAAVACHSGDHNHGHYWSLVRDRLDCTSAPSVWYKIDDAFVFKAAPNQTFTAPPEAYVFVYVKKSEI